MWLILSLYSQFPFLFDLLESNDVFCLYIKLSSIFCRLQSMSCLFSLQHSKASPTLSRFDLATCNNPCAMSNSWKSFFFIASESLLFASAKTCFAFDRSSFNCCSLFFTSFSFSPNFRFLSSFSFSDCCSFSLFFQCLFFTFSQSKFSFFCLNSILILLIGLGNRRL